jgi:uncharacterized protein (TIGR03083 family)
MAGTYDSVAQIRSDSARFAAALRQAATEAAVPTCPDWKAADLIWHLAEVQLGWAAIVRERLDNDEGREAFMPRRPDSLDELFALLDDATSQLADALSSAADDVAVWTWWPSDQTVGFIRRRQVVEALVHRFDAELTAGLPLSPIDAAVAADCLDQGLHVDFAWSPGWADLNLGPATGRIMATDTGDGWLVNVAHWKGTSPTADRQWAQDTLSVVADGDPSFTLSARAADLIAWLWNRATPEVLTITGNHAHYETLQAVVTAGGE